MNVLIKLESIYEAKLLPNNSYYLVDRLWPRGITKRRLQGVIWLKEIAPSHVLRRWYHQHLDQWSEFYKYYWLELESNPVVFTLFLLLRQKKVITLLYSSQDKQHNHAVVIRDFLLNKLNPHQ